MVVCTARAVQCSEPGLCSSCCNELFLYVLCNMINSAGRVRQCLASEIAVAVVFAIAYSRDSRTCFAVLWYRPILQAARQTTAGSIDIREVEIASKESKSRHNSRTKLRMKILYIQKRDNVEFYLCCKFQLSPFSVRRKTDVKNSTTGADASGKY